MASIKGPIQFNGKLGDLRSYYDSDLKRQIVSTKGGVCKSIIKNNPTLWRVNAMNEEFKGCVIWSKIIRNQTEKLSYLKKGRKNGELIRIAKIIQEMNTIDRYGLRRIESSKFNYPLIGFSLNNAHPFKDVFRVEPEVSITDDRREVALVMNNFRSHLKFKWPERVSHYRIYLNIFELPDLEWYEIGKRFNPVYAPTTLANKTTVSEWRSVSTNCIDIKMIASFDEGKLPREKTTVVVSMGLEFAYTMQHDTAFVVKDCGTTAIIACF